VVVVNLRNDPYEVYIGRSRGNETGYFGNPFRLDNPHDHIERAHVIAKFTEWFNRRIVTNAEYAQRVLDLRGKRCGCYCKPLPCHGDVLALWVEKALCALCGDAATIAVDPHELDEREPSRVLLVCGECSK